MMKLRDTISMQMVFLLLFTPSILLSPLFMQTTDGWNYMTEKQVNYIIKIINRIVQEIIWSDHNHYNYDILLRLINNNILNLN